MSDPAKPGRGRPRKSAGARKRNNLTMRLRDDTKAALEREALKHGRSVSEEIEARIEQSLRDDEQGSAGVLMLLARIITDAGTYAGFMSTGTFEGAADWLNNPFAYHQVVTAINTAVEGLRPDGDASPPPALTVGRDPGDTAMMGELLARGALEAVRNPDRGGDIGQWAQRVRERIGPAAAARIRVDDSRVMVSALRPSPDQPNVAAIATLGKDKR